MSVFIVVHPVDLTKARRFESLVAASTWAIRANRRSEEHPSYLLFELTPDSVKYRGKLWREFGSNFDVNDCWKLEKELAAL